MGNHASTHCQTKLFSSKPSFRTNTFQKNKKRGKIDSAHTWQIPTINRKAMAAKPSKTAFKQSWAKIISAENPPKNYPRPRKVFLTIHKISTKSCNFSSKASPNARQPSSPTTIKIHQLMRNKNPSINSKNLWRRRQINIEKTKGIESTQTSS